MMNPDSVEVPSRLATFLLFLILLVFVMYFKAEGWMGVLVSSLVATRTFQFSENISHFSWTLYPSLDIFAKFDVVDSCDGVEEKNWNEDEVFINLISSLPVVNSDLRNHHIWFTWSAIKPLEEEK